MPDSQASPPSVRSRLTLAARYEAGIWRSLYRWLTRRRDATDPDAARFAYASQITPLLLAFIFLSALEIPIVSLLVPWPPLRYGLLVLGIWGVLWMLGLLASLRTNPHAVSRSGLRLRSGFQFDTSIPWEAISAIRLRRSSAHQKLQIEHNQTAASVALQGTSNVEVVFREPVLVRLLDGRQANVDAIYFYADNPTALLTAAQAHLARIPEAA
jgi:Bacterial PH domain